MHLWHYQCKKVRITIFHMCVHMNDVVAKRRLKRAFFSMKFWLEGNCMNSQCNVCAYISYIYIYFHYEDERCMPTTWYWIFIFFFLPRWWKIISFLFSLLHYLSHSFMSKRTLIKLQSKLFYPKRLCKWSFFKELAKWVQ